MRSVAENNYSINKQYQVVLYIYTQYPLTYNTAFPILSYTKRLIFLPYL